jgi:hypothetical protein
MYGDGKFKGSAERARREQKALERKAKRSGREISGRDKARYQRAEGMEEAIAYQGLFDQDDEGY